MKKYSKCKYQGRIFMKEGPDKIIATNKVTKLIMWLIKNKPRSFSVSYFKN